MNDPAWIVVPFPIVASSITTTLAPMEIPSPSVADSATTAEG